VEEAHGLVGVPLSTMDDAEVRDDACLVLLVAELAQDVESLLEVPNRLRFGAPLGESKSKVVERQGLGLLIAEVPDDGERDAVLFGRLFVLAATSELRSELIQPKRLTAATDRSQPAGLV
jgi:hypothetical protein